MHDVLLVLVVLLLFLNGDWPMKIQRWVVGTWKRVSRDVRRRLKNAKARRRKRRTLRRGEE